MHSQTEIRERVTARIVEALQRGVVPWRGPWSGLANTGFPGNAVTKKPYSGINFLLLQLAATERGFRSKWWGTAEQWKLLGGQHLKPGGSTVVYDDGVLREGAVYNAEEIAGQASEPYRIRQPNKIVPPDYGLAERVIASTKADIRHIYGKEVIYYRPPADYIKMPLRSQFESGPGGLVGFFDIIYHELTHWSEYRLGWTDSYALGELRAEIGAAYLATLTGIPCMNDMSLMKNHTDHLPAWVEAMQWDHKVIFEIAAAANDAADFILSFSWQHERVEAMA